MDEKIRKLKKEFHNASDFYVRKITIGNHKIACLLLESVSSDDKISDYLMKSIGNIIKNGIKENLFSLLINTIPNSKLKVVSDIKELPFYLSNGFTVLLIEKEEKAIVLETKMPLERSITDSNNEVVLRGPKDSFTENHMINLGLIRKRIKDPNLTLSDVFIGRRTKTKVTMLYFYDLVHQKQIQKIENKLKEIDIDSILDSSTIKEFLGRQKTAFPTILSTERPDLVCMALLEGKTVILVENTPMALILPGLFVDYFHNTEDNYLSPINSSFTRILRILSFFVTLLTPAIYVSFITFHKNLLTKNMQEALMSQRENLFVSAFLEIFLLVTIFEILRESDVRIPNKMGTSIGVVGALVLGDAAVSAGLVSSIAVIITAITAISGLLFSDIDFIYALRIWRYIFLIGALYGGLFGVFLVLLILIFHLSKLKSVGIPYLSPIYPFSKKDFKRLFLRISKVDDTKRPTYLNPLDKIRKKEPKGSNDEKQK